MSIITRTFLKWHSAGILSEEGSYRNDALIGDSNLEGILLSILECKEREISNALCWVNSS